MWSLIEERLKTRFLASTQVEEGLVDLETAVREGEMTPVQAAEELLSRFSRFESSD